MPPALTLYGSNFNLVIRLLLHLLTGPRTHHYIIEKNNFGSGSCKNMQFFFFISINVYFRDAIARRIHVPEHYKLWPGLSS